MRSRLPPFLSDAPGLTRNLARPVRTFDTACTYYHKFRLNFRDAEYSHQDAALASLFVACKVEDTIKKSKDILAAAYNVKNPEKTVAPDDKVRVPGGNGQLSLQGTGGGES